jgi:hypothetical protein
VAVEVHITRIVRNPQYQHRHQAASQSHPREHPEVDV